MPPRITPRPKLPAAQGSVPALVPVLAIALAFALALLPSSAQAQESQETRSLYERMGGYDVIAATVDDFFARMGEDPLLQPLLAGVGEADAPRVRQHFVDFFCARTGGPCAYHGKSMAKAHADLPIEEEHFDATVGHLADALEAQGVAATEREEVLSMVRGTRDEIVMSGG